MEQNNNNRKSKIATIVIGIVLGIYSVCYAVVCISLLVSESGDIAASAMLFIYGMIPIVMLICAIAVVRMRIKEIEKGEIDEARKY